MLHRRPALRACISQRNFGLPQVCGLTNTSCAVGSSGLKGCSSELACRWWTLRCRLASRPRHTSPAFSNAMRDSRRARGARPTAFKGQPTIEKRFEQIKTVHEIAPVFLKNPGRIEALFTLYFLA